MCNKYTKSNAPKMCLKLLTILWPHEQVGWRTKKYQVYQYEPRKSISEHFVSKLWTILHLIELLLLKSDGHRGMALRLCFTAELFCSPVRNIFPRLPRTTFHIIGPWRYRFGISFHRGLCFWSFFCGPGGNPWFEHTSVIIHNVLANLTFSLSTTQINMVKEWCWFSQINVFHEYFPRRIDVLFLSN